MKAKKYMTIKEKKEYLINGEALPISFDPNECLNPKKKNDKKYVTTLVTSGDDSLIIKVKKGTRMLIGSGEHASFGRIRIEKKRNKLKILSLFKK